MAEFHEDKLESAFKVIMEAFADGFQWEDVATVIEEASVFADLFDMPGSEKRALALRLINRVIDETDTPWLPDAFTDPLLKRFIPGVVDLIIKGTKGKLAINKPKDGDVVLVLD